MEKMSFGRVNNRRLEDNFIRSLKNPNFVKVVNTLNTRDEIKFRYTSQLMEIANNLDICANCKGLGNCPYEIKGLVEYPVVEDNIVRFVCKKCKYKLKEEKDTEYLKNVDFYKMPSELRKASFKKIYKDDANRLETVKALKEFYDNYLKDKKTKGIYLHGNFGSGKSYLVAALFNELAKKNVKSTIVYFPELLRSLKSGFGNDNEFEERFDEIKTSPILLIDDIGAEKVTEWSRDEVLGSILQYRMDSNLPTFFTSNLSIEDLESHLALTRNNTDAVKARRIIERVKFLTKEIKMVSINRRN